MLPVSTYVIYIATLPSKVWQALISGAQTQRYFGGKSVESTWAVGTPVVYRESLDNTVSIQGEVLEYDYPNRIRLALHQVFNPEESSFPNAHITFELETLGEAVKLSVSQSLYSTGAEPIEAQPSVMLDHMDWPAVLSSLKTMLETGEAIDINKLSATQPEEPKAENMPLTRFFENP